MTRAASGMHANGALWELMRGLLLPVWAMQALLK